MCGFPRSPVIGVFAFITILDAVATVTTTIDLLGHPGYPAGLAAGRRCCRSLDSPNPTLTCRDAALTDVEDAASPV
jgi:hypothetical protein